MSRAILPLTSAVSLYMFCSASATAGQMNVVSVSPTAGSLTAPLNTSISVTFSQPVNPATIITPNFHAFGRWTGPIAGSFSFSNANQTVTFKPGRILSAGDTIRVVLSHNILAADTSPLRSAGYSFRFWTKASPAAMQFTEIDNFGNCSDPCLQTRIYGAGGTDLNNDGWADLSTINEVSSDLRVFLNKADGTGLYHDFLEPPEPLNFESSPNDSADFNMDGYADLAIASSDTAVVSILLGHGDGTFEPQQTISVGGQPHGIAVLDVDGDGDIDIVSANTTGNNCSLLLNNGAGIFGPASNFEGGGNGEYSLGACDMNHDGIYDLVVGCRNSQNIIVRLGNGNGTFTSSSTTSAGGLTWMMTIADVNGDGNEDVLSANSQSNNAAVLLGNGTGGLSAPTTYATPDDAVASDAGDLDGDGDLDWLVSSFVGGAWRVFRNNGAGVFTVYQDFPAPSNPSCSIILDIDNDRDLDLVLTDEIADRVILMKNKGPLVDGDMNCDGLIDGNDIDAFLLALLDSAGYDVAYPYCSINNADVNNDSAINLADTPAFAALLLAP